MDEQVATITPESAEPAVRVYDIPADATADETASIIEGHSGDYFMLAVVPWPGTGVRVFMRKHARLKGSPSSEAAVPASERVDEADAIIRRNPKCPPGRLADKLAEHGIVRGSVWVGFRRKHLERMATAANARREP